ncbi:MAG TPA: hypothetical protein VGG83_21430, partial [Trebonia sp.]
MGPCSAMGFAAAHVLALASHSRPQSFGTIDFDSLASVHSTDIGRLRSRLGANLGITDPSGEN